MERKRHDSLVACTQGGCAGSAKAACTLGGFAHAESVIPAKAGIQSRRIGKFMP
jgi:hypothetical protein